MTFPIPSRATVLLWWLCLLVVGPSYIASSWSFSGTSAITTRKTASAIQTRKTTATLSRVDSRHHATTRGGTDTRSSFAVTPALQHQKDVVVLIAATAQEKMLDLVGSGDNTTVVSVHGFVTKRRQLGSSLVFLDLVLCDENDNNDNLFDNTKNTEVDGDQSDGGDGHNLNSRTIQMLLRRDYFCVPEPNIDNDDVSVNCQFDFDAYRQILQPGCRMEMTGHVGSSRNPGEILLFGHAAAWLQPNSNPQHLQKVLQLLLTGNDRSNDASALDLAQVAAALQMAPDQLWSRLQPQDSDDNDDNGNDRVDCYQLAKDLLADMAQSNPNTVLWDPSKLMGSSNKQKVGLLPAVPADLKQVPTRLFGKDDDSDAAVPITTTTTTTAASLSSLDPPVSVQDIASQKMDMAAPSTVVVAAWVQNRRRYQNSVTILGVVDEFAAVLGGQESDNADNTDRKDDYNNDAERPRLKCVLHPDVTVGNLTTASSLLATGARVLMQGNIVHSQDGVAVMPTLWVTNVRLLRSSWRPRAVRHLLELVYDGHVAIDEAAGALELEQAAANEIADLDELTKRQWMAAEISRNLQGANSRVGIVSPQMQAALNHYASLREAFPLNQTCIRNGVEQGLSEDDASAGQASALWTSTPGSRWQRTKRPQLEWMIAQIQEVIKSHPDYGKRRLQVVDVGGGKGYLANLVAEQLSDVVDVRVVDISARAINNGMMRARRRNLENIEYNVGDATAVDMVGVDIVVALHACGALSDVAMGHAVANGAAFVVCPCCFRSNPHLRVRLQDQKQLVTVSEWLKTDHQDVEALQQLAEVQGDIQMAGQAIHSICALRTAAAQHHYGSTTSANDNDLTVEIKTFPISFSTRNFCIVGTVQQKMNAASRIQNMPSLDRIECVHC